jgi:hypothetical protein
MAVISVSTDSVSSIHDEASVVFLWNCFTSATSVLSLKALAATTGSSDGTEMTLPVASWLWYLDILVKLFDRYPIMLFISILLVIRTAYPSILGPNWCLPAATKTAAAKITGLIIYRKFPTLSVSSLPRRCMHAGT